MKNVKDLFDTSATVEEVLTTFAMNAKVLLMNNRYFDKNGEPQEGADLVNAATRRIKDILRV